ncbi:MAG: signal peptide peptidase SppA [Ekhidna sp.]
MAFLRNLLATLVGLIIFSVIGFFMFMGFIAAASADEVPTVKENTVLFFPMTGVLEEKAVEDPFLTVFADAPPVHSLLDILESIRFAKNDPRVKGIYIEPMYLAAGYASLQEIRDALIDFKSSGKFVYAYGEYISESDYYVASVADSLFLNPTGALEFNGLSANVTFFKGLFEKLDIEPQIFRVGAFKSYVEPYIRKDLSAENRLQYEELLGSMYDTYLENLAVTLGKPVEELRSISNEMTVSLPKDAEANGLIHKVGYEDELKSVMKSRLGVSPGKDLKMMKMGKYAQAIQSEKGYSSNKVAVIVGEGDLVMGGDEGIVGAAFAEEIRKARESDRIKAIVLRVNSPGGSMTASDIIWREIMLTKGKKPIIASFSSLATSGGYYIGMPADTIIAQPNTITGSIGIFAMWFNLGDFLENKIGINHDVVKTGKYSDLYTLTRSLSDAERAIIQRGVNEGYEVFTQKAADARGMSQDELKAIASGRVWSGTQALENGLVDKLGSFSDAVEMAAEAAGITDDYAVSYYPQEKPFIEEFFDKMNAKVQMTFFGVETDPLLKQVKKLQHLQGIQARMAGELEVK